MSSTSHIDMHREHTGWRKEDAFWRDELAIWEREIHQAIKDVPRLEQALRNHAEILRKHAASIRLYEQDFAKHEHALVEYEQGEASEVLIELAGAHRLESGRHVELRKVHEEVKEQQHALMAKWSLLLTALIEPEAGKTVPGPT